MQPTALSGERLAGEHGQYLILSLDRPLTIGRQLGLNPELPADQVILEEAFRQIVAAYSPLVTGILVSPELGYRAMQAKADNCGLLFCLERTLAETDPLSVPILQPQWSVEYVRNNGAAAKLHVPAQPGEAELVTKLELVDELSDSCRYEGVEFLLDLRIIDGGRLDEATFQEQQLKLVKLFQGQASLLALEYPRTALACLDLTAAKAAPWLLAEPAAEDYATAKEQLRNALTGGAVGCVISRLVLPEFVTGTFDSAQLAAFLQKEGRDRVLELGRICTELVGLPN